jgi:hypothetical protein
MTGCFALTSLILSVASQFFLPIFFLMYPLMGGLCWYILQRLRGRATNIEMLFEGFRRQFGPLAILNLIIIGVGTVAFIFLFVLIGGGIFLIAAGVPGLEERLQDPLAISGVIGGSVFLFFLLSVPFFILGQVGNFATLLILDCGLEAGAAMSLGWTATRPFVLKLVVFLLLNTFLTFVGMLALYVGVFITGAWATIALVYLYEDAFGERPGYPNAR